ncbi:hypothetical protein [Paenibacillus dokdonensis]|uniref:hypothetical protein n=1 Tax=Paenibacillus dokdonensis TaxID=2567944 RepID=UPI001457CA79|nr:hypothetical protein [Paenibacillus dokdonensis]
MYIFVYLPPVITAGIIWLMGYDDMIIWAGAATLIGCHRDKFLADRSHRARLHKESQAL